MPTWRARDVTREIDLVEEVARFKMEEIPFTLPRRDVTFGRLTRWQRLRRVVEDVLVGCGYSEAYTPTFVAEGDYRLPEPLSQEAAALRTSLAPSLVAAARDNMRVGNNDVALFEIARVYPRREGSAERTLACRRRRAGRHRRSRVDGRAAVRRLEARACGGAGRRAAAPPGQGGRTAEGWYGELHPTVLDGAWGAFELDLDALVEAAPAAVSYEEVSAFPEVRQDLAFVVRDDVSAGDMLAALRQAGAPELRDAQVFDEYRGAQVGEGKRSLAFRVAFGSSERTLTDEEAAAIRGRIVQALADRFGAEIRSG